MSYGISISANGSTLWIRAKSPAASPKFTHDPRKALATEYGLAKSARDAYENARPLLRGKLVVAELPRKNPAKKSEMARWPYLKIGDSLTYSGRTFSVRKVYPLGTVDALEKSTGRLVRITGLPMGIMRNPVGKSRAARMRRLSAIVAKAAAGSAYNKAKRKPRKLQYIARGTSKAAANAFAKAAKKLKLNPSPRSEVARAQKLFRDFTGHDATHGTKFRPNVPRTALEVGKLEGIMYSARRDGKTERYFHKFGKDSRPLLIAEYDGSQLGIVGGRYAFTDRGIVDT